MAEKSREPGKSSPITQLYSAHHVLYDQFKRLRCQFRIVLQLEIGRFIDIEEYVSEKQGECSVKL